MKNIEDISFMLGYMGIPWGFDEVHDYGSGGNSNGNHVMYRMHIQDKTFHSMHSITAGRVGMEDFIMWAFNR